MLNDIADALHSGQRALGPDPVWAIVQAHVQLAWSPELVRSLIAGDPALSISASNDTSLRRWEHARLLPHGPVICPGVPPAARQRGRAAYAHRPYHGRSGPGRRRCRGENEDATCVHLLLPFRDCHDADDALVRSTRL